MMYHDNDRFAIIEIDGECKLEQFELLDFLEGEYNGILRDVTFENHKFTILEDLDISCNKYAKPLSMYLHEVCKDLGVKIPREYQGEDSWVSRKNYLQRCFNTFGWGMFKMSNTLVFECGESLYRGFENACKHASKGMYYECIPSAEEISLQEKKFLERSKRRL